MSKDRFGNYIVDLRPPAVEVVLPITNTIAASDTLTVDTSGLTTGQLVTVSGPTLFLPPGFPIYVRVINANTIALYLDPESAESANQDEIVDILIDGQTGTLTYTA